MFTKKTKVYIGLAILIAAYPTSRWIWGETAQAYFDYRCETDAGEFIYRTVENVEGLFQMRPRDPKDYFSRLRMNDLPEDPFGHTDPEAKNPWTLFIRPPRSNYQYLESIMSPFSGEQPTRRHKIFIDIPISTGEKYWIYRKEGDSKFGNLYSAKQASKLLSKYGFTWREVRNQWDKFFGVWGGELIVKKLSTDETLGIRRGYFFWPSFSKREGICPKDKVGFSTYYFVSKILIPSVYPIISEFQGQTK